MRAFLINPELRLVTEVQHDDSLQDIYKLIGCDCIDVVRINDEGDVIYVDDEGLYKNPCHFFAYENNPHPLAGSGLVLGTGHEGESIAPQVVTLDSLQDSVHFISRTMAISMAENIDRQNEEAHKLYGDRFISIPCASIIKDNEYTGPSE